ncbi:hypothetical protein BBP40_012074 [Aspergillus hancockii]|nr:hypothetical protein BBP40_012074 [Aspergillus hancockii]
MFGFSARNGVDGSVRIHRRSQNLPRFGRAQVPKFFSGTITYTGQFYVTLYLGALIKPNRRYSLRARIRQVSAIDANNWLFVTDR